MGQIQLDTDQQWFHEEQTQPISLDEKSGRWRIGEGKPMYKKQETALNAHLRWNKLVARRSE